MGKTLALDIGEKRIGVAVSDDTQKFSFVRTAIKNDEDFPVVLDKLISDEEVERLVIGLPRNMDGTLGFQAEIVQKFTKERLESLNLPIEFEDETATSVEAENEMRMEGKDPRKDKELLDSYAAKIILESYLRRQS